MIARRSPLATIVVSILFLSGCAAGGMTGASSTTSGTRTGEATLDYVVDLTSLEDDRFEVTLTVDNLRAENAVYQFASTAPGAYEVMDIGRFVEAFRAYDRDGQEITSERISTNQWRVSEPERVAELQYSVAETWDTPVEGDPVMLMGGTSMESDHVLFNANAIIGFPSGMQSRPIRVRFDKPANWMAGTALSPDPDGYYVADNYDHLVDSPVLLGRLTHASLDVRGSKVDIYTYSMTGRVTSEMVLDATRDVLNAAGDFLKGLPVDRYTFLFHFADPLSVQANDLGYVGAWEHSYSSEYVFEEATFDTDIEEQIPSFVAHEFFHIVTPLNIHSEIIEEFNFATPVPSEHLWLYEGVTEWVAQTMQLRGGLIDLDEYLNRMSQKLLHDDTFDKTMSLSELSLQAYTEKGQEEYQNIYERGALVAGLLDLRLLDLSDGKRGLREVLLELADRYGPDRSFEDATFFDTFTEMTYPEVRTFFEDYVRNAKPLPVEEYYSKVGVRYAPEIRTGQMVPQLGLQLGIPDGKIRVVGTSPETEDCGFRVNDVIAEVNGRALDLSSAQELLGEIVVLDADVPFTMTVSRGEADSEEVVVTCTKELAEYVARHVFAVDPAPDVRQRSLRDAWVRNLD